MRHCHLQFTTAIVIGVVLLICTLPASARSKAEHKHYSVIHHAPDTDTLPTPKLLDRDLPRLLLAGKNRRFYVGVGGGLKATVGMDWGHPTSDPNSFVVHDIPMEEQEGNGAKFSISAQQTEIFVCFGAMPGEKYEVCAYINGMFMGDKYAFVLENAYLKFLGFTAGYGYGLFCDTEASPLTIDFQGPNALLSSSNGIFDYVWNIHSKWNIGIGAEVPVVSYTPTDQCGKVSQRIPDIPAMVQYNFPDGSHLRASGILRTLQYRDLMNGTNRTCMGYGLQLSGAGAIAGPLSYSFQAAYGRGISFYFQDVGPMKMDLLPNPHTAGRMEAVRGWGGVASLQYEFSSAVHASLIYSHLRMYPNDAQPDNYRYGQYAAANFFWHISPIVSCGLEYLYGRRVNIDGQQAHDNRLQAMLQVHF